MMTLIHFRTDPGAFRSPTGPLRPDQKEGTCGLCGGHARKLQVLAVADFIGWACEECRRQLQECIQRRFTGSGEHTEPEE